MVWCTPEENLFCICAMWNSSWMYTWATHTHTHTRYADVNDICFCIATHTCGNGFHSSCFWPVQLFRLCQSCNHWIYRKSSHNNNNLVEQSSWTTILHISSKYKMIERKDTRWVWDVKEKWVVPFSFVWKWVRCTQRHTHTNTLEVFAFSWTVQFTQIKLTHGTSSFYLLPLCVCVCLLYDRGSPPKAAPTTTTKPNRHYLLLHTFHSCVSHHKHLQFKRCWFRKCWIFCWLLCALQTRRRTFFWLTVRLGVFFPLFYSTLDVRLWIPNARSKCIDRFPPRTEWMREREREIDSEKVHIWAQIKIPMKKA